MSHDLSQPIRSRSEKAQKLRDASGKEGPHSEGVWTLKIKKIVFNMKTTKSSHLRA